MKYIILILLLSGCYSAEKAVNKALSKDREAVAKITRDAFPCVTTSTQVQTDTVYELLEVECPELGNPATVTDTLYKDKVTYLKQGRQVVYVPGKTVTVTKKVEDSAKIFLAYSERDKAVKEYEDEQAKRQRLLKWFWWLIIALLVSLGVNYIQFRKWL